MHLFKKYGAAVRPARLGFRHDPDPASGIPGTVAADGAIATGAPQQRVAMVRALQGHRLGLLQGGLHYLLRSSTAAVVPALEGLRPVPATGDLRCMPLTPAGAVATGAPHQRAAVVAGATGAPHQRVDACYRGPATGGCLPL
ncbi:hypothetical protein COCOBI_02-6720 [Coccomyxa sp. Obi]|nr:hypothetical protein COCOBI_02-6720 [Coccomyxa sp. Obi]